MHEAQQLLYLWLAMCGNVRYERIKEKCDYLNIQLSLCIDNPVFYIFYPLLYSGVVDFSKTGKYRITPSCEITNKKRNRYVISNPFFTSGLIETSFVGIYVSADKLNKRQTESSYCFSAANILSNYPSVDRFVRGLEKTFEVNLVELSSIGNKIYGLSDKNEKGIISYFTDLNNQCYRMTHPSENPDSKNIGMCYDRVINNNSNGIYQPKTKRLSLKQKGLPIMIYRILLIETLLSGIEPFLCSKGYVFDNIDRNIVKELNRIFCNTIDIKDE